jgi:hypothetical protein
LLIENQAKLLQGLQMIGLELKRLPERGFGHCKLALAPKGSAQEAVSICKIGFELGGLTASSNSIVQLALPAQGPAQPNMGFRTFGVDGPGLTIPGLGLLQLLLGRTKLLRRSLRHILRQLVRIGQQPRHRIILGRSIAPTSPVPEPDADNAKHQQQCHR